MEGPGNDNSTVEYSMSITFDYVLRSIDYIIDYIWLSIGFVMSINWLFFVKTPKYIKLLIKTRLSYGVSFVESTD